MNKIILLCFCLSINIFARKDVYDDFFYTNEMKSFEKFNELVEKRKDKTCVILSRKYRTYKTDSYLKRRIVHFYAKSNCENKKEILKDSLLSRDPILVIGGLNSILENKINQGFKAELETINKRFKTDVTVQTLLANIKKSRNK